MLASVENLKIAAVRKPIAAVNVCRPKSAENYRYRRNCVPVLYSRGRDCLAISALEFGLKLSSAAAIVSQDRLVDFSWRSIPVEDKSLERTVCPGIDCIARDGCWHTFAACWATFTMPIPCCKKQISSLWRKLDTFPTIRSFDAWSREVAYFQALAFLRDRKRDKLIFSQEMIDAVWAEKKEVEFDERRLALA